MKIGIAYFILIFSVLMAHGSSVDALSIRQRSFEYVVIGDTVEYKIRGSTESKGVLKGVDVASFILINSEYAKDKKTVYFENKAIVGARPEKFSIIKNDNGQTDYATDAMRVYYRGIRVPDLKYKDFKFKTYKFKGKNYTSSYVEGKESVFQYGKKLPWLDKKSLEIIEAGYLKDKNGVYYRDSPSAGIDPKTYVILENGNYVKDYKRAYYRGKAILNSDASTFITLKSNYYDQDFAKDKYSVYFKEEKISNEPESFRMLTGAYFKDKKSVFFWQNGARGVELIKLDQRDAATFEVLEPEYMSKDSFGVYAQNVKIENADSSTFQTLNAIYSKDAKNVYRVIYKLDGPEISLQKYFDAVTFSLVQYIDSKGEITRYLLKDKNGVYASTEYSDELRIIKNADPGTFHFLENDSYTADKQHVFFISYPIQGADPKTFKILEEYFSKDMYRVYFKGEATNYDVETFRMIGFKEKALVVEDKNGKKIHCVQDAYNSCRP
jgi:DKNYY family